jgi:hypothetical protein
MTEEERRRMASSAVPKFPEGQTASVRDWSQNPAVAAAMKTGNVSEIEKATTAARDAFRAGGTWAEGARQVPLNPTPALQQRTPEQQQDLLAQMRERGAAIGQRLEQESIQRGYAFRQGLAESEAQRALTPSFGSTVGREGIMRGAQATAEAERWRLAQAGRAPMNQEPISAMGLQFRRGSMGQYTPVRGLGGGPQPQQGIATAPTTPSTPTASLAPIIPKRSLGLTAESPLAFTPFGRTIGESAFRTPEIPPVVRSPLPRNVASSMRSPLGIPRFPYLRA